MESTFEQYRGVYALLEDEQSRDIYLNRLCWLISRDRKYLDAIVARYFPKAPHYTGMTVQGLMDSMPKDTKVVLYGAGIQGKEMLRYWEHDERFIGFCSRTEEKQKNGYCGYPVMSPEELIARKDLSVVISTYDAYEEIRQILQDGGYPEDKIYDINSVDAYNDSGQYFAPEFMAYQEEEIFLDIGCLNLSTSMKMPKYCKRLKKVYAFEPDPDNYKVCLERKNRRELQGVEVKLLPFGAWSERTTLCFAATNNGGSRVSANGSISVPVVSVDEAVDPADKITMIKMDIEGSELEALKGAKKTIQRDKPKLAICIYHKPEDMTDIPLYIKELVPEYKLYIRHHSNFSTETVLYAVMPEQLEKEE